MSLIMDEQVICPQCGTENTFYRWLSVTAWLDPDAAELARKGELNVFTCRKCGFSANMDQDILVSEEGKMTFYINPKKEET